MNLWRTIAPRSYGRSRGIKKLRQVWTDALANGPGKYITQLERQEKKNGCKRSSTKDVQAHRKALQQKRLEHFKATAIKLEQQADALKILSTQQAITQEHMHILESGSLLQKKEILRLRSRATADQIVTKSMFNKLQEQQKKTMLVSEAQHAVAIKENAAAKARLNAKLKKLEDTVRQRDSTIEYLQSIRSGNASSRTRRAGKRLLGQVLSPELRKMNKKAAAEKVLRVEAEKKASHFIKLAADRSKAIRREQHKNKKLRMAVSTKDGEIVDRDKALDELTSQLAKTKFETINLRADVLLLKEENNGSSLEYQKLQVAIDAYKEITQTLTARNKELKDGAHETNLERLKPHMVHHLGSHKNA